MVQTSANHPIDRRQRNSKYKFSKSDEKSLQHTFLSIYCFEKYHEEKKNGEIPSHIRQISRHRLNIERTQLCLALAL